MTDKNQAPGDGAKPAPNAKPGRGAEMVFVTLPRAFMAILMLVGIAINFSNVISRYVFRFALYWAEEVLVFMVLWGVFIGIVAVSFKGAHLKMDLLSARIADPWKLILNGLTTAIFLMAGAFVVVHSYKFVSTMAATGQVSNAAGIPMVIPHSSLLVGFVLMLVAVLWRIRAYLSGRF